MDGIMFDHRREQSPSSGDICVWRVTACPRVEGETRGRPYFKKNYFLLPHVHKITTSGWWTLIYIFFSLRQATSTCKLQIDYINIHHRNLCYPHENLDFRVVLLLPVLCCQTYKMPFLRDVMCVKQVKGKLYIVYTSNYDHFSFLLKGAKSLICPCTKRRYLQIKPFSSSWEKTSHLKKKNILYKA